AVKDFRELCVRDDLDAILVATPDHWHALITLEALRSGKDVYCEKPVTHRFAEGQMVYREVAARKAIFQTGSQQRSDKEFHQAVELIQNGVLGKLSRVEVGLPAGYPEPMGSTDKETPPDHLDYEFWTGPAPMMPYMRARNHRWWRGHTAYGGGNIMDWIGHHNDIAHWGAGFDGSGPLTVEAVGWTWPKGGDIYDCPVDFEIRCEYPGDIAWSIGSANRDGTTWHGENGAWVWVNRGKIEASNPGWLAKDFNPGSKKAYLS
ncbi:MAG: Gfo/Idh/MocA family oxidoreductase, partial [Verrucomicrobiae bacterium]|nr:Gfo/Idh/MocA family oxidoreductase [Verrucomicrobiae bacterium]